MKTPTQIHTELLNIEVHDEPESLSAIECHIDYAADCIQEALNALWAAQLRSAYHRHDVLTARIDRVYKAIELAANVDDVQQEIDEVRSGEHA